MDAKQDWAPFRVDNLDSDPLCHKPEAKELVDYACDKIRCIQTRSLNTGDFYDFQFKNAVNSKKAGYPDIMKIDRNYAELTMNMSTRKATTKIVVRINNLAAVELKVYEGAFTLAASVASAIALLQLF